MLSLKSIVLTDNAPLLYWNLDHFAEQLLLALDFAYIRILIELVEILLLIISCALE